MPNRKSVDNMDAQECIDEAAGIEEEIQELRERKRAVNLRRDTLEREELDRQRVDLGMAPLGIAPSGVESESRRRRRPPSRTRPCGWLMPRWGSSPSALTFGWRRASTASRWRLPRPIP
jgi:hypothetical protein